MRKSDSTLFKEALVSLATDSGLHPLVPYFTYFISDEVIIFGFQTIVSILMNKNIYTFAANFVCSFLKQYQVSRGLNDYSLLFALMRVVWSLLQNPHIHIEPYVS